jgi:type I restriction enzyme M protein
MNHVLSLIDAKHRARWGKRDPSPEQQSEWFRERHLYLSQNIFGLDLNPNLVRAAKMNMVMNNDGSGQLFQCNSLEHPHRWPAEGPPPSLLGSVDVVFANPPFGTEIVIDDPRILSQFEVGAVWDGKPDAGFIKRIGQDEKAILQSSQPPEVLFVERCLQFLKPGGRMAIVLPNGLLNNPGLAYFRYCILQQAQLLAVVDMHRDLFQPRNDTQTSMVLFRKWGVGESAAKHGDYPIFMAVADAVGHDKRGKTIYKRAPDGSLLLQEMVTVHRAVRDNGEFENVKVTAMEPIVNDELDEVAAAYHRWLGERADAASARAPIEKSA